jgi:hypothetical protein
MFSKICSQKISPYEFGTAVVIYLTFQFEIKSWSPHICNINHNLGDLAWLNSSSSLG